MRLVDSLMTKPNNEQFLKAICFNEVKTRSQVNNCTHGMGINNYIYIYIYRLKFARNWSKMFGITGALHEAVMATRIVGINATHGSPHLGRVIMGD